MSSNNEEKSINEAENLEKQTGEDRENKVNEQKPLIDCLFIRYRFATGFDYSRNIYAKR